MRRIAEAPESAPTRRGDGAFTPTSWQQMAPYVAFAGACYLVAPYLGLDSFTVDPRIADLRAAIRRSFGVIAVTREQDATAG